MMRGVVFIIIMALWAPARAADGSAGQTPQPVPAGQETALPEVPEIDATAESARAVTDTNRLITEIKDRDEDAVRAAIQAGADINRQTTDGSYPIIVAAVHGTAEIMKILTAYGVDVSATDTMGRNALHYAAMMGDTEKAALMVAMRAPANVPDNDGITPLFYAYLNEHLEVADLLLSETGASVNALDDNGTMLAVYVLSEQPSVAVFKHMLEAGLNIFRRDSSGFNLVETAARMEKEAVAELLQAAYDERLKEFQEQQQEQESPSE